MRLRALVSVLAAAAVAAGSLGACSKSGTRPAPGQARDPVATPRTLRTALDPKPLSPTIAKGLAWLAAHQLADGGWGQGDESQYMGENEMRDVANVADTSMALLAFLRAGSTASEGEHRDAVRRGIEHVLAEIEASDDTSLAVTDVTGTRIQMKIGSYADTFAALMMLNEAKGTMRDGVANARVDRAIRKVVKKIERNQREDGAWDDAGWAPVLSMAMAAKGLNRSEQNGFEVDDAVLARIATRTQGQYDGTSFGTGGGAGVELYGAAAATPARDDATTKRARAEEMKRQAEGKGKPKRPSGGHESPDDVPSEAEIAAAEQAADQAEAAAAEIEQAVVARMSDPQFVAGFGNNGGEEFLSHLMIGESLALKGGEEWSKWDAAITELVNGIQNGDGSWTGHHCITGRTFCTAAALLVLMADRTPVPDGVELAR